MFVGIFQMHGRHVSTINCTFCWSHEYWMFPWCTCRIWAASVNGLCGHQLCAGCIMMQWVQCARTNARMDEFDCPVCCQSLPGIVERSNQTRENMPFWEDSRTQHLITELVEEVTKGINKHGDEIEHLGGEDGHDTLKEWKDVITHCEMIQPWVHYLDMMTDVLDFRQHFSAMDGTIQTILVESGLHHPCVLHEGVFGSSPEHWPRRPHIYLNSRFPATMHCTSPRPRWECHPTPEWQISGWRWKRKSPSSCCRRNNRTVGLTLGTRFYSTNHSHYNEFCERETGKRPSVRFCASNQILYLNTQRCANTSCSISVGLWCRELNGVRFWRMTSSHVQIWMRHIKENGIPIL